MARRQRLGPDWYMFRICGQKGLYISRQKKFSLALTKVFEPCEIAWAHGQLLEIYCPVACFLQSNILCFVGIFSLGPGLGMSKRRRLLLQGPWVYVHAMTEDSCLFEI